MNISQLITLVLAFSALLISVSAIVYTRLNIQHTKKTELLAETFEEIYILHADRKVDYRNVSHATLRSIILKLELYSNEPDIEKFLTKFKEGLDNNTTNQELKIIVGQLLLDIRNIVTKKLCNNKNTRAILLISD